MKSRSPAQRASQRSPEHPGQRDAGGAWSLQLKQSPRQGQQAAQLQALQRAGLEEEEPMQGKALQRAGLEEEEPMQGKALQRAGLEEEDPMQGKAEPAGGGLPAGLRRGIESMAGMDLSDVQVHRNSAQPAQVQAAAYAQGNQVHLGPGQEQHLPHEAWHVVQQRQGRVRATAQLAGVGINDDAALEQEADQMGARAQQLGKD